MREYYRTVQGQWNIDVVW